MPPAAADWRSELEHIQSGKHWTFQTLGELVHFLDDFLLQLGKRADELRDSEKKPILEGK